MLELQSKDIYKDGFISSDAKFICFDKALDDSTRLNLRENLDLETL